jgi:hypothetical protein
MALTVVRILLKNSSGMKTGMVKKLSGGMYLYNFDHSPNSSNVTRRIELFRLPAGATIVSTTPDLPHKRVEECEQIFVDVMIPPGGHNAVAFRYRLDGAK